MLGWLDSAESSNIWYVTVLCIISGGKVYNDSGRGRLAKKVPPKQTPIQLLYELFGAKCQNGPGSRIHPHVGRTNWLHFQTFKTNGRINLTVNNRKWGETLKLSFRDNMHAVHVKRDKARAFLFHFHNVHTLPKHTPPTYTLCVNYLVFTRRFLLLPLTGSFSLNREQLIRVISCAEWMSCLTGCGLRGSPGTRDSVGRSRNTPPRKPSYVRKSLHAYQARRDKFICIAPFRHKALKTT